MIFPAILLLTALAVIGVWVLRDRAEYVAFKALAGTRERQRTYLRWVLQSFLAFGVVALGGLAMIGELRAPLAVPDAFAALRPAMEEGEGGMLGGIIAGALIGGSVGGAVVALLVRRRAKPLVIGDIEPLLPRNAAERWCAVLLSLNAGFSEELFFRLLLPVLIVALTGQALAALIVAALLFGIVHLYQGWAGVVGTTLMGGLMTFVWLATGSILVPMMLHAMVDLNGLVLAPWLRARLAPA